MLWNISGKLVQIYIGKKVFDFYTAPDNRSILDKWLGDTKPAPGQILAQGYNRFQKEWDSEGLVLPDADIYQNNLLFANNVLIYYGIERHQFPVEMRSGRDDLAIYLYQKTKQYAEFSAIRGNIQEAIAQSIKGIPVEGSTPTLETLSRSYFWSTLQDFTLESVLSLGYAGNFALRAFDVQDASSFMVRALQLSMNTNIVDAETKTAIANDAGTALRIRGINELKQRNQQGAIFALKLSRQCYEQAIKISEVSGDLGRLFFALCGCAGTCLALNELDASDYWLQRALLMTSDPMTQRDIGNVRFFISKRQVNQLLISNEELKQNLKHAMEELERNKFINKLSDIVLPLLFHATTALVYGGAGLLGESIKLSNVTINGPSVIGFKNLQQLL